MGGMNALGGPGVWAGGQGGLQNVGQFGALGFPVQPGPAGEAALEHFGQQAPQNPQQTILFGGLEQHHPLLAKMLEGGIMGAAMTPNSEPGRSEGAGGGISRALQGVLGARGAERQFQIQQIVAPYQLARQTAELQGAAQEQEARKAQISEMNSRAHYFDEMANMTAPEARVRAAQMGMQFKDEELKAKQTEWAATAKNYADRTAAMAQWHQKSTEAAEAVGRLRAQVALSTGRARLQATQQLSKLADSSTKEYSEAVKNRDSIAKELKDYSNSVDYLTAADNSPAKQKYQDLETQFAAAQTAAESAQEINQRFGSALQDSIKFGTAFDPTNPTNPRNAMGGELGAGRGTSAPNDPLGILSPKK